MATDCQELWVSLQSVHETGRSEGVYNVLVAELATYFVGKPEWGFGLWAHNTYYERYASLQEVENFYIYDGFTVTQQHGIRFAPKGAVDPSDLAKTKQLRAEKYGYKFEVDLSDETVDGLRDLGVAEAPGHHGSLHIATEAQLDYLNANKGKVTVTNVANGQPVGGIPDRAEGGAWLAGGPGVSPDYIHHSSAGD